MFPCSLRYFPFVPLFPKSPGRPSSSLSHSLSWEAVSVLLWMPYSFWYDLDFSGILFFLPGVDFLGNKMHTWQLSSWWGVQTATSFTISWPLLYRAFVQIAWHLMHANCGCTPGESNNTFCPHSLTMWSCRCCTLFSFPCPLYQLLSTQTATALQNP